MRTKEEILESIAGCVRIEDDIHRRYQEDDGTYPIFKAMPDYTDNMIVWTGLTKEAQEAGVTEDEILDVIEETQERCDTIGQEDE